MAAQETARGGERQLKKVISLNEIWTYAGARRKEKRNSLWAWTAAAEERDCSRWMDFEGGQR